MTPRAAALAALLPASASSPAGGCCAGCSDMTSTSGLTDELKTAKWFVDNRWAIIGVSVATGGILFATISYFVNRNP